MRPGLPTFVSALLVLGGVTVVSELATANPLTADSYSYGAGYGPTTPFTDAAATKLTDGIIPAAYDGNGTSGPGAHYAGALNDLLVTFDFGNSITLTSFALSLYGGGHGISFPGDLVHMRFSNDPGFGTLTGNHAFSTDGEPQISGVQTWTFTPGFNNSGRYVELKVNEAESSNLFLLSEVAFEGPVTIPEPAGAVLLTLGFAGLGIRRRRDHCSDSLSTPSRLDPHESTDS
jgi:hypothetical protein